MNYVREVDIKTVVEYMKSRGFNVYTKPQSVNIYLLRSVEQRAGEFDDAIGLFYTDNDGSLVDLRYKATTDPGLYYLHNPLRVEGTAIWLPGQYVGSHKVGRHKNGVGIEQIGEMFYYRDDNKDSILDNHLRDDLKEGDENVYKGNFKTNIHTVENDIPGRAIGRASAGCGVIASKDDFRRFYNECKDSTNIYGNSLTTTLITEKQLKEFEESLVA